MAISIQNKRIIEFCDKYPNFNVEDTLLSFIDFIERTYNNSIPSLNSNLASDLLQNMKTLQQQMIHMETSIAANQKETIHDFTNRFVEFRKEYLEDIRNTLSVNNNEKVLPILKEYNEIFINKVVIMFNELVPKNNSVQTMELSNFINHLENVLLQEFKKNNNCLTQSHFETFAGNIENKFSSILLNSEKQNCDLINTINNKHIENSQINNNIAELLNKLTNSNTKGKISEELLHLNLQSLYGTAEILHVGGNPHTGDFILKRKNKPDILIENKNYDKTVYGDEVEKFINDINTQNICGIMLSQKSKIVHTSNYQIEVHNGNLAIYVHDVNYDSNKIKLAIEIIDSLKQKMDKQLLEHGSSFNIEKEILESINKEFQLFCSRKIKHIGTIRQSCDDLIKSAEQFELPSLSELLEQCGLLTNVKKWVCNKCGKVWKTEKGLETHYRSCIGEKQPLICKHCEHIAKTPKGLLSHCLKQHNIVLDNNSDSDDN